MRRTHRRFVRALVAGCLLEAGLAAAQDSQAGGLPAIADRVAAVEVQAATAASQIAHLLSAVNSLQSSTTSLTSAVNSLTARLNAERSERLAFQQSVASQIGGLSNSIGSLSAGLTAERNDRIAADDALRALAAAGIATFAGPPLAQFLPNGAETVLSNLQLPAGKYLLTAKAEVRGATERHIWNCSLVLNGTVALDRTRVATERTNELEFGAYITNVVLVNAITLTAPSTVDFRCFTGGPDSLVDNIRFIGLKLAP